jgi:hypothetical protein
MSNIDKIVEAISTRTWSRFKRFMALVALGMMIQNV